MKRERNSFLTPLDVRLMESGKRFMLLHQFTYKRRTGATITVPIGFKTDFASIPRLARILIPKLGKHNKAAVIHDYLYQIGTMLGKEGIHWIVTREIADKIFLEGMVDLGVVKWKRTLMYWAVRLGGWMAWKIKES